MELKLKENFEENSEESDEEIISLLDEITKDRTKTDNSLIRTYAYMDSMDPASSFKMFQDWFIRVFKAHHAELIKIGQKKGRVAFLDRTRYSDAIDVVSQALEIVLADTDWGHIDYDGFSEVLTLTNRHDSTPLEIRQLSDGLRSTIGLVADMAYRCYQLNKHLGTEAAAKAEGIVLIDEVDMHLHPSWQQKILHQLQTAFPNIQFIITTHSPQVLSTVPSECIRILENGEVFAAPPGSEGAEPGRLLKQVLGLSDVRPLNNPATQELQEYLALVDRDQWASPRALELRKILDSRYQGNEPALVEADIHIENRKWEMGE